MKRTVDVARTAHDLTHVNRLVVPAFGVRRLALVAGGKASKSYVPKGSPPPSKTVKGSDDFHFVPEKEVIEIQYEIDDKFGVVDGAALQFFTRFDAPPVWTIDLKPLGRTWWSHGEHSVRWDGRLVKPTAEQKATIEKDVAKHDLTTLTADKSTPKVFPDGFVTLEHTPYKLKIALTGKEGVGRPEVAWTYWHILIKSLALELGPEPTIPAAAPNDAKHKQDKAVRTKVAGDGGIPADGSTRKIVLPSNVYKTALSQMDDNTGHTALNTLWGDGPNVPIVAKIRLLDSADGEVKLESDKGAVALGHAKFLWDWVDPDEAVATQNPSAKPKGFITDAITYYKDGTDSTRAAKDHTYPKGDNCHVDHGGKRGPDARPVFPPQAGYAPQAALKSGAFPFLVKACTKRKWAALSEGWTSGAMKGMTGVVFQPSRMGGDDYKLTVYLAYDKKSKTELVLDDVPEPLVCPDAIKSKTTGTFQMWREVHIARYIRKKTAIPAFLPGSLAGTQAHLRMAYIEAVDKMGGATNSYELSAHRKKDGTTPNYDTLVKARLTATGHVFVTSNLIVDPAYDHSTVDSMFRVRNYADFVQRTHVALHPGVAAAATDIPGSGIGAEALGTAALGGVAGPVQARLATTKAWLVSWAAETRGKYSTVVDNIGFGVGEPLANDLELIKGGKSGGGEAPPGVTTIHFNFTNTYLRDLFTAGVGVRYWYGAAIDPTDADLNRCLILFWKAGGDEFSHEYGHHLFLPHARYPTASPPGGAQAGRHDDTDSGCLMSYSASRPAFCGLCQLRMRGWSATKLDKTSASNKKP
jgi:hypothetical protein